VYLTGHVASSLLVAAGVARLQGTRVRFRTVLLPAARGGITPDLPDKAILALGASRYGRTVGHSLLFLATALAAWAVLRALSSRRTVPFVHGGAPGAEARPGPASRTEPFT
jgi:uncharacterized membrane protein (UPF0136 family)